MLVKCESNIWKLFLRDKFTERSHILVCSNLVIALAIPHHLSKRPQIPREHFSTFQDFGAVRQMRLGLILLELQWTLTSIVTLRVPISWLGSAGGKWKKTYTKLFLLRSQELLNGFLTLNKVFITFSWRCLRIKITHADPPFSLVQAIAVANKINAASQLIVFGATLSTSPSTSSSSALCWASAIVSSSSPVSHVFDVFYGQRCLRRSGQQYISEAVKLIVCRNLIFIFVLYAS